MIYNCIPENEYIKHYHDLHKEISNCGFPLDNSILGQTFFNITKNSLHFFIDDYAAYLAFFEKHKDIETIHLGLNVVHNFVAFWDYIGYALYLTYDLSMDEEEVYFDKSISLLKERFKDYPKPCKLIDKLKQTYDKDSKLRKSYRHINTHRYCIAYVRKGLNESSLDILTELNQKLDESFKNVLNGLRLYYKLMEVYAPYIKIVL